MDLHAGVPAERADERIAMRGQQVAQALLG